jgi:hypothetical protein
MSDNIIKIDQAENIAKEYMKRFDLEIQGYSQDKSRRKETITIDERGFQRGGGADVVFGSLGYTHPITDRLNATIRASGVYVKGKDFKVMTPTYIGGELEYSF